MPSNEEKNRNGNAESDSYGMDALTELSAEEIEKLLAEGAGTRPEEPRDLPQGDVLEMLEEAGDENDDDLQDIQDMLRKSDRNEAIDAGAMEETGSRQGPADRLLADIEGAEEENGAPVDAKTRKAREKPAKPRKRRKRQPGGKRKRKRPGPGRRRSGGLRSAGIRIRSSRRGGRRTLRKSRSSTCSWTRISWTASSPTRAIWAAGRKRRPPGKGNPRALA